MSGISVCTTLALMTDLWNSCVDNCRVEAGLSLSCVYYSGISLVCDFCVYDTVVLWLV